MGTGRSLVDSVAGTTLGNLDRCPACEAAVAGRTGVCDACRAWLEAAVGVLAPPSGDQCWVGPYAGPLERLVKSFKHGGGRRLGAFLGGLIALRAAHWGFVPDVVTNVPASAPRLAERGFDQAAVLAKEVATRLGLPVAPTLARSPVSASQKHLSRAGRAVNAGGAFGATGRVSGRLLLVDDVLTTGATFGACSAALLAAGAKEVRGAFVARTVRSQAASKATW